MSLGFVKRKPTNNKQYCKLVTDSVRTHFLYTGEKTDNWMGVKEMIVSTSVCGMLFSLFAGQPLIILGGTGPVLLFESFLYEVRRLL